jgi:hypothetical protein
MARLMISCGRLMVDVAERLYLGCLAGILGPTPMVTLSV